MCVLPPTHVTHEDGTGVGTDERALIEIICTRNNAEIKAIKAAYKEMFERDLEKDVVSETSGHFKRILVSGIQGNRQEVCCFHVCGQSGVFKKKFHPRRLILIVCCLLSLQIKTLFRVVPSTMRRPRRRPMTCIRQARSAGARTKASSTR